MNINIKDIIKDFQKDADKLGMIKRDKNGNLYRSKKGVSICYSTDECLDPTENLKYLAICEKHGETVSSANFQTIKKLANNPRFWCYLCRDEKDQL